MITKKIANAELPILYIHGGLGNQLFQLAAANVLFEGRNYLIDMSKFSKNKDFLSKFSFGKKLNILPKQKKNYIEQKLINLIIRVNYRPEKNDKTQRIYSFIDHVAKLFLSKIYLEGMTIVTSSNLGFDEKLIIKNPNSYLIGYFQSYVWPSDPINQTFFEDVQLVKKNSKFDYYCELSKIERPLIVHIRLGDYLGQKSFGLISKEYYHESIKSLWSTNLYDKIWIFSNEPDKVKPYIPSSLAVSIRIIDLDLNDAAATLQLMRYGHGYVLSNSTFGWWGAFLTVNRGARVIAPKPWFKLLDDPNQIIPFNWSIRDGWKINESE